MSETMTIGEKTVWANAFVLCLNDGIKAKLGNPELSAVARASIAVKYMRESLIRMEEVSSTDIVEMLREMLGKD